MVLFTTSEICTFAVKLFIIYKAITGNKKNVYLLTMQKIQQLTQMRDSLVYAKGVEYSIYAMYAVHIVKVYQFQLYRNKH